MSRAALRLTFLGLAVVVAAGCGGGASPEAKWAESSCATVLPYAEGMKEAFKTVRRERLKSGAEARAEVFRSLARARGLTDELVSKLKLVPAPDTRDGRGRDVKMALVAAALRVQSDLSALQSDPQSNPPSLQLDPSHHGLQRIQDAIAGAASFIHVSVELSAKTVPRAKDAPRYTDAFESADSCRELNAAMGSEP